MYVYCVESFAHILCVSILIVTLMIISISGTYIEDDFSDLLEISRGMSFIITLSDGFLRFILGSLAWRATV